MNSRLKEYLKLLRQRGSHIYNNKPFHPKFHYFLPSVVIAVDNWKCWKGYMLPFAKYYTLSRNKRDSLTATRPCIHSVHDHITFTHHNTASAAMKLILALQMNWCTRRRSSRRSLTSLTRRLQKCPATKLPREDHFSRLPLQLQPPSTFTSLHVFREDTCSHLPGKARKSASFAPPSPLEQQLSIPLPVYLPYVYLPT